MVEGKDQLYRWFWNCHECIIVLTCECTHTKIKLNVWFCLVLCWGSLKGRAEGGCLQVVLINRVLQGSL